MLCLGDLCFMFLKRFFWSALPFGIYLQIRNHLTVGDSCVQTVPGVWREKSLVEGMKETLQKAGKDYFGVYEKRGTYFLLLVSIRDGSKAAPTKLSPDIGEEASFHYLCDICLSHSSRRAVT
uniref:Uncharacterized protein n=1 Tax=Micrurus paraensis TaxID=1970185 RepID=A0A2D4KU79_9SAUR